MTQIEHKFVRWDALEHRADERCEGPSQQLGQCPYVKVKGSNFCQRHGGHHAIIKQQKQNIRNYRLLKYQTRVNEMADSEGIKSLREEIGILRVILEEMLNQCHDATDLLLFSQRAADLVMKIERLVLSCDKMEGKMGLLLSKDSVLQLAGEYVAIITQHVKDNDIIDAISMDMMQATLRLQNPVANAPATGGGNRAQV